MNRRLFILFTAVGMASAALAQACPSKHEVKITETEAGEVRTSVVVGDNVQIRIGEDVDAHQGVIIGLDEDLGDLLRDGSDRPDMD